MLKQWVRDNIKSATRGLGYEIGRWDHCDLGRRSKILSELGIDSILDVGANRGQYAGETRLLGFAGQIHSFEPIPEMFHALKNKFKGDAKWRGHGFALGDQDTSTTLKISENQVSSSILPMADVHQQEAPESRYVREIEIQVRRLDSIINELALGGSPLLKIDTQGFEKNVLLGAKESLPRIKALQIELSLIPLYEGETLFAEMIDFVGQMGFELWSLEPGFASPKTGRLLQVDGLFARAT